MKIGLVLVAATLTACGTAPAVTMPAAPVAAQAATVRAPQPPRPPAHAVAAPVGLDIPAVGARTDRLVGLRIDAEGALEPPPAAMAGWFELGPRPGAVGPAVIAAHVEGVFARLREIKPGDEVDVRRADGSIAVFTTYRADRYPPSAFPTERVYGDTEEPELRLITCGGRPGRATDEYADNVVAYAKLATVR
jgi:hypothetical protein